MNPPSQNPNSPISFPPMDAFPQSDGPMPVAPIQAANTPSSDTLTPDSFVAPTISTPSDGRKFPLKKVAAGVGVFVLLVGVVAGVVLNRSDQVNNASAWDCSKYTFNVSSAGSVTVQNGSSRSEPQQQAQVSINGTVVENFTVPALNPGQGATLGTVSVPVNQSFAWNIKGSADCENSGNQGGASSSVSCLNILAYDSAWNKLSASQLSALKSGADVIFTVSGTATSGSIDMARFSINGAAQIETSSKKPGTEEFYVEYKIPSSVRSFTVEAQLHHSTVGWF